MLAVDDLSVGLLDALDQLLELEHDLIDALLVEPHLLEGVQDLLLQIGDLLLVLLLGRLGDGRLGVELLRDLLLLTPQAPNLVDDLADALDVPLLIELGVLFVGVLDDLFDADLLLAQLVAELEDLLDRDRRIEHDLQHAPLAVLDPLGNFHLALAGEEGDRPHLAQVHAHRVVGLGVAVGVFFLLRLFLLGLDLLVFLFLFGLGFAAFAGHLDLRRRIDDLDALARERGQPVVHLVGRHDALRHVLVDLVIGQKALGLAHGDELALLALALLGRGCLGGAVLGRLGRTRNGFRLVVHVVVLGFVFEGIVFHFSQGLWRAPSRPSLVFRSSIPRTASARAASSSPRACVSRWSRVFMAISASTRESSSRLASFPSSDGGSATSVRVVSIRAAASVERSAGAAASSQVSICSRPVSATWAAAVR